MGGGPVIYIKAEQSTYLNSPDVRIRDICSVYCQDRKLEQKVGGKVIHRFEKEKEGRAFVLRPSADIHISRLEKDPKKLEAIYELGYEDAREHFEEMAAFAERARKA